MEVTIKDIKITKESVRGLIANFTAVCNVLEERLSIPFIDLSCANENDVIRLCGQMARQRRDDKIIEQSRKQKQDDAEKILAIAAFPESLNVEEAPVIEEFNYEFASAQDSRGYLFVTLKTNLKEIKVILKDVEGNVLSEKQKVEVEGPVSYNPSWHLDSFPDSCIVFVEVKNNIGEVVQETKFIELPQTSQVTKITMLSPEPKSIFDAENVIEAIAIVTDQRELPISNIEVTFSLLKESVVEITDNTGKAVGKLTAVETGTLVVASGTVTLSVPVVVKQQDVTKGR